MSMTKAEREVIRNVIAKLSADNTTLDSRLVPHREALRNWLDTWIIAPLDILASEERSRCDLNVAKGLSK
jgi:hypothetical protein